MLFVSAHDQASRGLVDRVGHHRALQREDWVVVGDQLLRMEESERGFRM